MYDVSCLRCGCQENLSILWTYNLFPSQLLTKDTKYFHDLYYKFSHTKILHPKISTSAHTRLNSKNGEPWEFEVSLKNKFSCLMTLIELVHQGNTLHYSLFTYFLLISNYIAIIIYIFDLQSLLSPQESIFSLPQNFNLFI